VLFGKIFLISTQIDNEKNMDMSSCSKQITLLSPALLCASPFQDPLTIDIHPSNALTLTKRARHHVVRVTVNEHRGLPRLTETQRLNGAFLKLWNSLDSLFHSVLPAPSEAKWAELCPVQDACVADLRNDNRVVIS
jgi:hypothetical protein